MLQTEELHLPDNMVRDQDMPPALLPSAPRRILITTERGKDAPLSLAGYQLNFGRTYEIRVSQPVAGLHLAGYPSPLIKKQGDPWEATVHGQRFRCLTFSVRRLRWWNRFTQPLTYPHELEVEVAMDDGRKVLVRLPIAVQERFTWSLVILLALGMMFTFVLDVIKDAFWKQNLALFTSLWPWLWGLTLGLIYPVWVIVKRTQNLWQRAKELQQEFATRWAPR